MTCSTGSSLSVTGIVDFCTATGSCKLPLSLTLTDTESYERSEITVAGGSSKVANPGTIPSNFLLIETIQPVQVQINGGAEFIPVERLLLLTGDITALEVFNDVASPAKDTKVTITFASGTYL